MVKVLAIITGDRWNAEKKVTHKKRAYSEHARA